MSVVPPAPPRLAGARVLDNRALVEGIHRVVLLAPRDWGEARAGQFVQLECPPEEHFGLRRPFSLADCRAGADGVELRIVYGVVGPRTRGLATVVPGRVLEVVGPLGRPFLPVEGRRAIIVGGGRGIAPVLMLARQWGGRCDAGGGVLIYGARTASMLIPLEDPPCPVLLSTDDGSAGEKGTVLDLLDRMATDGRLRPEGDALYACGPNVMLAALDRWSVDHGVPCQLSLETHFGCGLGICAGCAVPIRSTAAGTAFDRYVFACREGPVFEAGRVEWAGVHE